MNNININVNANEQFKSDKSLVVSLLLLLFLGVFGVHRMYLGKWGTGIIFLLTGGLFGIGIIYDFVVLITRNFKDCYGKIIS